MQKLIRTLGLAMMATAIAGCGIVYTPDVQQGNLLDKKNVDQLQPGMTKRQVLVLLGTPSVISPFDSNRWDYVSTFSHRGRAMTTRTLTLTFNNDVLVRSEGDFFAQDAQQLLKDSAKYKTDSVKETKGDKNTSANDKKSDDDGIHIGAGASSDSNTPTPADSGKQQ
ncbi:outer membrane protein assembly factor BamE [Luteibacter anthropi]|uniref:Outer membrane protein assembly factor BamE n=1 Tax=Luteibacter anthropi TaxID=564369 RepID=A0A7X5ZHF6_9GAMM|nr:outer membrane protein assembly factor BamE [Luteibacter anthropi]NII05823.1 outer membrane protein assembly factor BamE [Luteibacter anthropi]URX62034.1 outer membrane protein assembly factor BamE [Luteibacter anthropi]